MPFRRATWDHNNVLRGLYIAIVTISALVMAILFVLIINDKNDIKREATVRANQIQQQRYDTTYGNCIDTNQRNKKTIHQLDVITAAYMKKHPEAKAAVKDSLQQQTLLIDALVPVRNCKVVAAKAVHPLINPTTGDTATTTGG